MQKINNIIKPDIVNILIKEGIELNQRGKYFWGLCPLHPEKTPSFKVDSERQTFYCFGCNQGGNVISFIIKLKGLSFKDALRYLGITTGKPPKINYREIKKKDAVKNFKVWCEEYYDWCCEFYRLWYQVKMNIRTIEDAEKYAPFYHREPVIEHYMDLLCSNDNEAKFELYREVCYG
jgi:hypothetical protein